MQALSCAVARCKFSPLSSPSPGSGGAPAKSFKHLKSFLSCAIGITGRHEKQGRNPTAASSIRRSGLAASRAFQSRTTAAVRTQPSLVAAGPGARPSNRHRRNRSSCARYNSGPGPGFTAFRFHPDLKTSQPFGNLASNSPAFCSSLGLYYVFLKYDRSKSRQRLPKKNDGCQISRKVVYGNQCQAGPGIN